MPAVNSNGLGSNNRKTNDNRGSAAEVDVVLDEHGTVSGNN